MSKPIVLAVLFFALIACGGGGAGQGPVREHTPTNLRTGDVIGCTPTSLSKSEIGKQATICGPISAIDYQPDAPDSPTFIYFDFPPPDHTFSILIKGDARGSFSPPPEQKFSVGTRGCVEGLVETANEKPHVIVTSSSQLEIC